MLLFTSAAAGIGRLSLLAHYSWFKAFCFLLHAYLYRNVNDKYHKTHCLRSRILLEHVSAIVKDAMQNAWFLQQDALKKRVALG